MANDLFDNRIGFVTETFGPENDVEVLSDTVEEMQKTIEDMQKQIDEASDLKITQDLDIEQNDAMKDLMSERITDIVWDEVFYVSSMDGPAVETTSGAEKFDGGTRQSDTSAQKFLSITKSARFRCSFYFNGTDSTDATTYIGSHGASNLASGITSINEGSMQHLALRITNGELAISARSYSSTEVIPVSGSIVDDATHVLEINYFPGDHADFYLDDVLIGTVSEALPQNLDILTVMPLMVSIKRGASTNRTVTVETWEYIQDRN